MGQVHMVTCPARIRERWLRTCLPPVIAPAAAPLLIGASRLGPQY